MSRIANIIRGLFGRKPVHQQKDSMAPRGNGDTSGSKNDERGIRYGITDGKCNNRTGTERRWKHGGDKCIGKRWAWDRSTGNNRTDNEEWGNNGSFML